MPPLARTGAVLSFILRLAFFAIAPFALVQIAAVFPVTGALVQIALGLVAFFAGEALRRASAKSKIVRFAVASQLQFEEFYKKNPPRPFLYYVFYPLLFPYWIVKAPARREFLLYKGYTLASFVLLLVSLGVQYWRFFPPELGPREFLPIAAGTFLAESIVVLMFLMPIVTSIVYFHTLRARKRQIAILLVGLVSVGVAFAKLENRRDPVVSFATRIRVGDRTTASPKGAEKAQIAGLHAAWKIMPAERADDVAHDGKVVGDVLEAAQAAMTDFYKPDEANAFDLWSAHTPKGPLLVLYFEARAKNQPIWLAMTPKGEVVRDTKQLPRNAFNAMWRLTQ